MLPQMCFPCFTSQKYPGKHSIKCYFLKSFVCFINSFLCTFTKISNGNSDVYSLFFTVKFLNICSANSSLPQIVLNLMGLMTIEWGAFQVEDAKRTLRFSSEFDPHNSSLSPSAPPFWPLRSPHHPPSWALCPSPDPDLLPKSSSAF